MSNTPRIYVGTYAKYNDGNLYGQWLDLEDFADADAFYAACRELHKDEEDPELMFQDWEGIPDGMVGESWLSDDVWEWLDLDDDDREILQLYRENVNQSGDIEEARDSFGGKYSSPEDYAQELTEEHHQIPDFLVNYIAYDRMARDMEYEGTRFVYHQGEYFVFRPV